MGGGLGLGVFLSSSLIIMVNTIMAYAIARCWILIRDPGTSLFELNRLSGLYHVERV